MADQWCRNITGKLTFAVFFMERSRKSWSEGALEGAFEFPRLKEVKSLFGKSSQQAPLPTPESARFPDGPGVAYMVLSRFACHFTRRVLHKIHELRDTVLQNQCRNNCNP